MIDALLWVLGFGLLLIVVSLIFMVLVTLVDAFKVERARQRERENYEREQQQRWVRLRDMSDE